MIKYKAGDKVVVEIEKTALTEKGGGFYIVLDYMQSAMSVDEKSEPLSTYTEPLEAKINRQAAEITRLLAENKELKEDFEKSKRVNLNMGRVAGQNEAWELVRKITCQPINGGFNRSEFEEIFDEGYISDIFEKYTYAEAAAKVAEWEKERTEFERGNVVKTRNGNEFAITFVNGDYLSGMAKSGQCYTGIPKLKCDKTGRHIDIDGFLKQIGGEA